MEIKKGDKFLCIKNVPINKSNDLAYLNGYIYKSEENGCITDLFGNTHHNWKNDFDDCTISTYFKKIEMIDVTIEKDIYNKLCYLGIIDESGVRMCNIGNSNYTTHLIQPWSIWLDYPELTAFDKDVIKRILRTKKGDSRKMDYEKIMHICKERLRQFSFEDN